MISEVVFYLPTLTERRRSNAAKIDIFGFVNDKMPECSTHDPRLTDLALVDFEDALKLDQKIVIFIWSLT